MHVQAAWEKVQYQVGDRCTYMTRVFKAENSTECRTVDALVDFLEPGRHWLYEGVESHLALI